MANISIHVEVAVNMFLLGKMTANPKGTNNILSAALVMLDVCTANNLISEHRHWYYLIHCTGGGAYQDQTTKARNGD